jgi:hypothetical protein
MAGNAPLEGARSFLRSLDAHQRGASDTGRKRQRYRTACRKGASKMLDLIMLAIGLGFFALTVGYAYACDRL